MMPSSQTWLRWASFFMPVHNDDWLAAMTAELSAISNPKDRNAFAFGCFKAALLQAASSRKGLNYIMRAGGAIILTALSSAGFYASVKWGQTPEHLSASKILMVFCIYYMCGAALLLASLRGLRIYAAIGFCVTLIGWAYYGIARPRYEHISTEFLMAINFEAAGLIASLFFATIYLSWLYTPDLHDA